MGPSGVAGLTEAASNSISPTAAPCGGALAGDCGAPVRVRGGIVMTRAAVVHASTAGNFLDRPRPASSRRGHRVVGFRDSSMPSLFPQASLISAHTRVLDF